MEAIVLAGGLGTRLRAVVADIPKPMAPINGRPFLELQLDHWIAQGIERFVLSVGYKAEAIMAHFGDAHRGVPITYAIETTPLGTGGGLLLALQHLSGNDPVLVVNGDTYLELDLAAMREAHRRQGAELTMALIQVDRNSRYGGVVLGGGDRLLALGGADHGPSRWVNAGVYLMEPAALARFDSGAGERFSLEGDLFPSLLASADCFGFRTHGRFVDIGVPEDYFSAAAVIPRALAGHRRYAAVLEDCLERSIAAKRELVDDDARMATFDAIARTVVEAYRKGGRLYIAGNGGSAADAQHLAAEFVSKLARDRAPLPAEALTVDSSILTAIGNDYGYEKVFERQVRGKIRPGDVFLGITTSGRSPNINLALVACRELGIPSIVFCGRDGGEARELADHCLLASGTDTGTIQEQHIVMAHALCACVEAELFPQSLPAAGSHPGSRTEIIPQ